MAGLFGQAGWSPDMAQEQAPPRLWGAVPGAQKGPGFFDTGGLGSKLLNGAGTFANTWLALSGNEGAQQSIHDNASMQHAAMLRAQSLQDQRDTWLQQQAYEQAHPKPHYFESNNGDQYTIGADGKPVQVFKDPTPKVTWIEADDGHGGKVMRPFINGMPPEQASGVPTAPVGKLTPIGGAGLAPRTFR